LEAHGAQPTWAALRRSDQDLETLSTWLVAPTSTSARAATFRPAVQVEGDRTRVLVEQTSAVDPSRLGERVGHLGFDELRAVDAALRLLIAL
jgi:mRNA interferase MazF